MIAPWMTAAGLAHEIHTDVMASEAEIAEAINALVQREVRKAVLEEREACARLAMGGHCPDGDACDYLSPMDPETGAYECYRSDGCLCDDRHEYSEKIAKLIRERGA